MKRICAVKLCLCATMAIIMVLLLVLPLYGTTEGVVLTKDVLAEKIIEEGEITDMLETLDGNSGSGFSIMGTLLDGEQKMQWPISSLLVIIFAAIALIIGICMMLSWSLKLLIRLLDPDGEIKMIAQYSNSNIWYMSPTPYTIAKIYTSVFSPLFYLSGTVVMFAVLMDTADFAKIFTSWSFMKAVLVVLAIASLVICLILKRVVRRESEALVTAAKKTNGDDRETFRGFPEDKDIDEPFDFSGYLGSRKRHYEKRILAAQIINSAAAVLVLIISFLPIIKLSKPVYDIEIGPKEYISVSVFDLIVGNHEATVHYSTPLIESENAEEKSLDFYETASAVKGLRLTDEKGEDGIYVKASVPSDITLVCGYVIGVFALIVIIAQTKLIVEKKNVNGTKAWKYLSKHYTHISGLQKALWIILFYLPIALILALRFIYCFGYEAQYSLNMYPIVIIALIHILICVVEKIVVHNTVKNIEMRGDWFVSRREQMNKCDPSKNIGSSNEK